MTRPPARGNVDPASPPVGDVLERVSDAVVALDREWRYTYVNRHAAALFGRRPEDLIGKHIWTEFPEGVGQPFHRAYERAVAEQTYIYLEAYYEPWHRWFENRIFPSPDGVSIFFHEITERKLAEDAARRTVALLDAQKQVFARMAEGAPLHETLDRLVRLIEAQGDGMIASILLLDPDGLHVRHGAAPSLPEAFNRAVDGEPIGPQAGSCGTAAYRRQPVIVEDISTDPLWERYRALALEHGLRACWSTPILDADGNVLGTFALYFRTPKRPSEQHLELIERSTYTAAVAITKDREAQALRASDEQLRIAQRIARLGSYEWDVQEDTVRRSDELCRIFGLRPEEFPPTLQGYLDRVHEQDRQHTRSTIEQALRDRVPFEFEERIVRPDGAVRLIYSQGTWILDQAGNPVKLIGICHDVTDRKETENQLRRSRARNEELKAFAYTVSHDLKAPLRGIAGYARELDHRHHAELSERARVCVASILTSAQTLDRHIEDLLQCSRLDAEAPRASRVDLVSLVDGILAERRPAMLDRGVEVTVDLAVKSVHTWERGLAQVLTNIIDNALKYSRNARPPRLRISSHPLPDAHCIEIEDNGIGFDMRHRDRIFGLFTRLVPQEQFEGTGAGLAIVKKVMDKIGGRVWATSTPDAGTTFFVELPAEADR